MTVMNFVEARSSRTITVDETHTTIGTAAWPPGKQCSPVVQFCTITGKRALPHFWVVASTCFDNEPVVHLSTRAASANMSNLHINTTYWGDVLLGF